MSINPKTGFFDTVEDFISFSGGDHAIKKILIANNGIGAVKAIRSIRRWALETFGNERMVSVSLVFAGRYDILNALLPVSADQVCCHGDTR
jgi:biotin carboxylase